MSGLISNALARLRPSLARSGPSLLAGQRYASTGQPQAVIDKVNAVISSNSVGQTFAVVQLYDKQHLVHVGDIISVQYPIPAEVGDKIKLEKCMAVGSDSFSLVGRPVLNRDLVQVEATVVEKSMTQTYFDMFHIPRNRGFRRYRFKRHPLSMLRINDITVCHPVNSSQQKIN